MSAAFSFTYFLELIGVMIYPIGHRRERDVGLHFKYKVSEN